ncbi:MAG: hypothetical protein JSV50_12765 [Desulfobacteraceae bacterium]|nr:MAG: hypothetical protein JSV50_12765 [Desulfobacteraceae bacterium]
MDKKRNKKREVDTKRLDAFRHLSADIVKLLTKEEVQAFLHDEEWPDSLREKLRDYLADEQ